MNIKDSINIRALAACISTALCITSPWAFGGPSVEKQYTFKVISTLGEPAPGGGVQERYFQLHDINASGSAVFLSSLDDDKGNYLGEGLYLWRNGAKVLITRSGNPAPGTPNNFSDWGFGTPSGFNDAGDGAFLSWLDVPGDVSGVWRYTGINHSIKPVLLPGQAAPDGTTFRGAAAHVDRNNGGDIVTSAVIDTDKGNCTDPKAPCYGTGRGVYKFDKRNHVTKIAAPGDQAPGGALFDDAWDPNLNDRGDVVFGGHVKGETCVNGDPSTIGCFENLYLYRANTRQLSSVAHQGDSVPGGGTFEFAFNGRLNNVGDISFIGFITGGGSGVFVRDHNNVIKTVAATGTLLPGGVMTSTTLGQSCHGINNSGAVAFVARLDADENHDSFKDTGVYLYNKDNIQTVVRTGMEIPGLVGRVAHVNILGGDMNSLHPFPGVHLNERGQVLTQVIMDDGSNHVIIATPK